METLRKLIFGEVLSRSSRAQLAGWMVMNKTGGLTAARWYARVMDDRG